ncbi:hypothetical protein BH10BAC2_BH10BAC2_02830 [soil metagenome]
MPSHEQVIELGNMDTSTALALVHEAMQNLAWDTLYAGENVLMCSTRKGWKTKGQQLICTVAGSQLTVRSEMVNGEMMDVTGINKKNTNRFASAFEAAVSNADEAKIAQHKESIESLSAATQQQAEQQQLEAVEVDKAMNLSGSNLYVTYTIIAINVLVFILMAVNGAGIVEPNGLVHIQWGSNYTPLTLSGDWWRLFTNMFIHFGIIHLAMNMYCLYTVGVYLEPMLGKARYIAAYICTGIIASTVSLWWHAEGVNSAGASGAIFGIYGLFLALLTTSLIPKTVRESLLKSIGLFVAYNLLYGMKSGVDNAAHIGGLISGFIIGYLYVYGIKKERDQQQKLAWIIPVVALITIGVAYGYLQQNKVADAERIIVVNQLKEGSYKDNEKFNEQLAAFDSIHETVNAIVNDTSLTDEELIKKIDETGFPQWQQAEHLVSATTEYDISTTAHAKAQKLLQYIALRKKEMELLKQVAQTQNTDTLIPQINAIRSEAYALFDEIVKQ